MKDKNDLPVFLGVCKSVLVKGDGVSQDFYGVSDLLALPFFPQKLKGLFYLLGLPEGLLGKKIRITLRSKSPPNRKGWTDLQSFIKEPGNSVCITGSAKFYTEEEERTGEQCKTQVVSPLLLMPINVQYKLVAVPFPHLIVYKPDQIDVIAEFNGCEFQIGAFRCEFCLPPPISEEERTAIKSRPGAINLVGIGLQCKKCQDRVEYYLTLDQKINTSADARGAVFLPTAPNEWNCRCGEAKIPLIYLKQGLHDLFRRAGYGRAKEELQFVPLYQKDTIGAIREEYQRKLVDYADDEESMQKFIEANPILWNFLAAKKIWEKPPILTKHKADFGILTASRIFYFVEIEKPATKLVTKSGGITSNLQKGFDQIRNWQLEVDKQRGAVLDCLHLAQNDVHDIRYILIAGMSSETTSTGMEKIRRIKDPCSLICFDDLASYLYGTEIALLNV